MEYEPPVWKEVEQALMDAVEDIHNPLTLPEALERLNYYKSAWLGRVALEEQASEETRPGNN